MNERKMASYRMWLGPNLFNGTNMGLSQKVKKDMGMASAELGAAIEIASISATQDFVAKLSPEDVRLWEENVKYKVLITKINFLIENTRGFEHDYPLFYSLVGQMGKIHDLEYIQKVASYSLIKAVVKEAYEKYQTKNGC